jgi:ankyrin repeat protein
MSGDGARLISAATDGDLPTVKAFLNNKVDVNSRDWDNLTALIAASSKGQLETVKFLITKGSSVNLRDKDNVTALMEASVGGHLSVVEYLVKNNAEVDAVAASGISALWLASGEGKLSVVNYLLQSKKADPNIKRADGVTTLMAACSGGHEEVVRALLGAKASVAGKVSLYDLSYLLINISTTLLQQLKLVVHSGNDN